MNSLEDLFKRNQDWVNQHIAQDPRYFLNMSVDQSPKYLWIGCSDSRVPANEVVGLPAGELFVHRNIANLFTHTDFNCLSVLQYAIEVLEVPHIIVCGHYGCGGVAAAMGSRQLGLVDNWLRNIRDVYARNSEELNQITNAKLRYDRLVELNTIQQVLNIGHTTIVQNAWARKKPLWVHGWVYVLESGKLQDLNVTISNPEQLESIYLTHQIQQ